MNIKYTLIVLAVVIIVAGAVWYTKDSQDASLQQAAASDLGTYAYECDEHVEFSLTPASDMSTMRVDPKENMSYPPAVTLMKKDAAVGVRYEGGGLILTARGETVTLGEGDSAINCSPVPSTEMAPFNFGD